MTALACRRPLALLLAVALTAGVTVRAQAPSAATESAAKAKELAALLQAKKLEAFAARDAMQPGRYVAAIVVPGVQLLVVSAAYSRVNDIEYSLYNKKFQDAYLDLKSGALSTDRFFVDDAMCDGLVAVPGKNPLHDAVHMDGAKVVFDGDFVDPKKKNTKKIPEDVYRKNFATADMRYAKALDLLITELKRNASGTERLAGAPVLR
jgi:hypothetical protein